MKTRTMNDGYVWIVVDRAEALSLYNCGNEVYKLYDDGSEALCESDTDIKLADTELGIGLGFSKDMLPDPTIGEPYHERKCD